jgi:site-specific recombinase XerD
MNAVYPLQKATASAQPASQTTSGAGVAVVPDKPKLLDQVRHIMRLRHYAYSTEQSYVDWIRRFILFHNRRHPQEMGKEEIEAFLTHLAVQGHVAASTQNQAYNAILFLYRRVLELQLPTIDALRAKRPRRFPVVLSRDEVREVLRHITGAGGLYRLMAELLYGAGLRLLE